MDLLILTSALDRSASAMTSATVTTALAGPDAFPQLVMGTVEPITVKHYSAASTVETWSYDPLYIVVVSLGLLTNAGLEVYSEATLSTVITNLGKSGNLLITTAKLVAAMNNILASQPNATRATFTLQVSVTDPSGNRRVFAQLPVKVAGTVPNFTQN